MKSTSGAAWVPMKGAAIRELQWHLRVVSCLSSSGGKDGDLGDAQAAYTGLALGSCRHTRKFIVGSSSMVYL